MEDVSGQESSPHAYVRTRVANACDSCKARKVKCDGKLPCSYCLRRQRPLTCRYSPQQRRRAPAPLLRTPSPSVHNGPDIQSETRQSVTSHEALAEEETEVPREARLLCDAQGKIIFIGDCAPLSFFQTVRQLVNTRVDPQVFAHQTENPPFRPPVHHSGNDEPTLQLTTISGAVVRYHEVTSGLVDLFGHAQLGNEIKSWARQNHRLQDAVSATFFLVLAMGYQSSEEDLASSYFEYARNIALANLSGNINVPTIQTFILVTVYMLGSCQMNGAFLFFGIAVRAAYSIGIHRTEINSRFGADVHRQRDRLWKSLRVLDLFLSTSMGRPPATSDVDCTVPYRELDDEGQEIFDLLNASAQIFLITEGIVVEVYSRRKVSYQLTEGISRQLRDWSIRWLQRLKDTVSDIRSDQEASKVTGACQVLCSYYYAVILVSRPFLMYELHKRLADGVTETPTATSGLTSGKSKLADACIDAASFMVDILVGLVEKGVLIGHMPLVVSWLFASSLILGVGLLGSFGRILEKYTRNSILVLEHFAKTDAHASQYSLIAKSLLNAALEYLEKKELRERMQRTESSSQLFGLVPRESTESIHNIQASATEASPNTSTDRSLVSRTNNSASGFLGLGSPSFVDVDASFLGLSSSLPRTPDLSMLDGRNEMDHGFGDLNLFQLLDGDGHIDLGPYI
ncbi:fungal-specific transcription factor domain-containing protein [Colletotrichum acutatum]|uniref:Fungal-specific transcription factor domain-containing protein n=1 Tax=Glomerella acutata TaxID=27357 RepID=A0AAD8UA13_GLOAC|nr:fungal-specific transcription factor domain-containing protein [Colletotrichum acutatum]KAK1711579.1 fungal-specific transcription factor domain-containing protein [Colletotrichum acutatum]